MKAAAHLRVDQFWDGIFGSGPDDGTSVHVVPHGPRLAGYPGIYAVLRGDAVHVSAPPDWVKSVHAWRVTTGDVMDPRWWAAHLPGWTVLGPSVHSFSDRRARLVDTARRASLAEVRRALAPRVSTDEWEESGFGGDNVEHAWLLRDDDRRPVAASNLTLFDGVAADVGILVSAGARGRGHGVAIASAAVSYAVDQHGIARWRALEANVPSRAIAARLGFEDDCRQLAMRPA